MLYPLEIMMWKRGVILSTPIIEDVITVGKMCQLIDASHYNGAQISRIFNAPSAPVAQAMKIVPIIRKVQNKYNKPCLV